VCSANVLAFEHLHKSLQRRLKEASRAKIHRLDESIVFLNRNSQQDATRIPGNQKSNLEDYV
jgi:hypothetical protein